MNSSKKLEKSKKFKKPPPAPKPTKKLERKQGDWVLTLEHRAHMGRPADFTFKGFTELSYQQPENARISRLGLIEKGPKFALLSHSLWLNNNKLTSLRNIQEVTRGALEFPQDLAFLDVSCNELTEIHDDLFKLPNITILYLHGNKINEPTDIYKLRKLKKLQHLTLYGNPLCDRVELGCVRKWVACYLPNLRKLDHNRYTALERNAPLATKALKILRSIEGEPEDWLFKKFPKPKLSDQQLEECKKYQKQASPFSKSSTRTDCSESQKKCADDCVDNIQQDFQESEVENSSRIDKNSNMK